MCLAGIFTSLSRRVDAWEDKLLEYQHSHRTAATRLQERVQRCHGKFDEAKAAVVKLEDDTYEMRAQMDATKEQLRRQEEDTQLKLLTRRSRVPLEPNRECASPILGTSTRLRRGRFPDLQKVFTKRGRWCCLEGRLTVHEEVRLCACLHFERRLHLHLGR